MGEKLADCVLIYRTAVISRSAAGTLGSRTDCATFGALLHITLDVQIGVKRDATGSPIVRLPEDGSVRATARTSADIDHHNVSPLAVHRQFDLYLSPPGQSSGQADDDLVPTHKLPVGPG
jgi:hypothetical protein